MTQLDALTPGNWTVDQAHSTVGFTARHLMITKVHGRFEKFSGTIHVADQPLQSTVEANVDLSSINTGDAGRDEHLRGADFFGGAADPTMVLRSTGIKVDGESYKLSADLTINGVTHPVEFELDFEGVGKDPWGGTRAAFSATTEINRKEWGLAWNVALETGGVLVGDKVKVNLDIQAVKS